MNQRPGTARPAHKFDALWWELRQEESAAARAGGDIWSEFVKRCERRLGVPWATIRQEFDRIPLVASYE